MKKILHYILFFIPVALVVMSVWSFVISANLFYCTDPVPFLDFFPPFSHGSQVGDYFIADQKIVWALWSFLVLLIILLPWYFVQKISKKYFTIAWVIILVIIGFSGWFYIALINSPVGPPGPSENETTNCTIQKDSLPSSFGYVKGTYFVFCGPQMYVVGKSNSNLDIFLDKKVKIKAKYEKNSSQTDSIKTNIQCIQEVCKPIFNDKNQTTYTIILETIQAF